MDYSYFPGCTLKNKARDLDAYARVSAKVLGFNLIEIEDWQCCGAVYPLGKDETASKLSCVRALAKARDAGRPLVTLCSACYNVLKQVNADMQSTAPLAGPVTFADKVNRYLAQDGIEYHGETKVMHYLEVLRDEIGWAKVKEASKNAASFKDKKIGAYYGCLLLRPSKILKFDDPENPTIIEDFIRSIGATPIIYAQRNECCGAYTDFSGVTASGEGATGCECADGSCEGSGEKTISKKRIMAIMQNAHDMGVQTMVTSCPLCKYNLEKNKCDKAGIDVVYFSQMLAEALGVKEEALKMVQEGGYYA